MGSPLLTELSGADAKFSRAIRATVKQRIRRRVRQASAAQARKSESLESYLNRDSRANHVFCYKLLIDIYGFSGSSLREARSRSFIRECSRRRRMAGTLFVWRISSLRLRFYTRVKGNNDSY